MSVEEDNGPSGNASNVGAEENGGSAGRRGSPGETVISLEVKRPQRAFDACLSPESKSSETHSAQQRSKLSRFEQSVNEAEEQSHGDGTAAAAKSALFGGLEDCLEPAAARAAASSGQDEKAPALEPLAPFQAQDEPVVKGSSPRLTLMEAITRKRAVTALYNGSVIKLAPHQIFERHGDLFVAALNLGKTWKADEERRLGQFKFAGLGNVRLLEEAITPLPSFKGELPRPEDILILSI
ncbi:hypothetical protein [Novosphingobium sp. 9U]|uniref:hypothetical protein n=1 Tax=Novosphingobium sp. 9U TaxID=2653158 RepID=UPI001F16D5EA|nr:hypothetical protein [Novosphingobium sp. 9U]